LPRFSVICRASPSFAALTSASMPGTTIQAISIYKMLVPLREPFVISAFL
jgi:hypothetical protein